MSKFHRLWSLLLLLIGLGLLSNAFAERLYQVELVVFSRINQANLLNSEWLIQPGKINLDNHAELISVLAPTKLQLNTASQKIVTQLKQPVLLHLAWQQTASQLQSRQVIHLYGGKVYSASGELLGADIYRNQPFDPKLVWQLNGSLAIQLHRYFNLSFNLWTAEPVDILQQNDANFNADNFYKFAYYHILQQRRTRSGVLNYLDNPVYGILVKIIRLPDTTNQPAQQTLS
ncbi:MAG: peptidoglycan binding protein CsiV [Gammaproteobacteria bacterium]|nr:peptidoglycan binding protein CsiV [Gammaproteobacteria bacterium]